MKYGGRGIPYLMDAESRVRAEVKSWECCDMDAKRMAVSCTCGGVDEELEAEGSRVLGQERVECVRRFM